MPLTLANLVLFKLAWLAVVFGAANQLAFAGTLAVVTACAWHLHVARDTRAELTLLVIAALTGLAWESLLISQGVIAYSAGATSQTTAPYWIVAMWVLFATTLNLGLRWIRRNLGIAMVFGAISRMGRQTLPAMARTSP